MAGREKDRREWRDKRPKATLDLEADEVNAKKDGDVSDDELKQTGETVNSDEDVGHKTSFSGDDTTEKDPTTEVKQERGFGQVTGSFFKLTLAALFGGVVALLGSQFMPQLVSPSSGDKLSVVEQQIGGLQGDIKSLKKAVQNDELVNKLASLEKQVGQVGQLDKGVQDRLQELEKTIADLAVVAKGDDGQIAGVAAIASRVNGIETRVGEQIAALEETRAKLITDMKQVAKTIAEQESLSQLEVLRLKTTTLGQRLAEIEAKALANGEQIASALKALDARVGSLQEKGITRQRFDSELLPLQTELESVTKKLTLLTQREAEAHENARRSALALAFANLKRSVDKGEPFGDELKAVKQLSKGDVDFGQIETLSDQGVPTEQALLDVFSALAIEALKKGHDGETNSSTWDKFLNKARATFKYRRTGDVKGDDGEAILARMEHKFRQGLSEEVLVEFKKLSGAQAQVIAPWAEKLNIRLMIEAEMHRLEDELLQSLRPR